MTRRAALSRIPAGSPTSPRPIPTAPGRHRRAPHGARRAELEQLATDTAEAFAALGVGPGDIVVLALPNCVEFVAAMIASWKVGATPTPVSSRLPKRELDGIVELAAPALIVGVDPERPSRARRACRAVGRREPRRRAGEARLDTVSDPWKGMTSGGSTGRPKLILQHRARADRPRREAAADDDAERHADDARPAVPQRSVHVVGHRRCSRATTWCSAASSTPSARWQLIDQHHPESMYVVPTMMARISKLPDDVRDRYDVSSLKVVWHLGAPCPPWLKADVDRVARRPTRSGSCTPAPKRRPRRSSRAPTG